MNYGLKKYSLIIILNNENIMIYKNNDKESIFMEDTNIIDFTMINYVRFF